MLDLFGVAGEIARRQHGALSRRQLIEAGVSPECIRTWVRKRQLHPLHQGIYAIAAPSLLPLVRESAALLAVGADAAVGYRSAAALWGLADSGRSVDVIVVRRRPKRRTGVRIHYMRRLHANDVTTKDNLRITTPARSVIDFATNATLSEVEYALSEGRALNLINDARLTAALDRAPANHPGAANIRALLRSQVGRAMTRSERERKLLKLLAAAGLPKPLVNQPLHGYRPDFYWPEQRLILEFDGYQFHGGRRKFESDRKRDQRFAARGIQTVRSTWLQLEKEAVALVVSIAQALAARGG